MKPKYFSTHAEAVAHAAEMQAAGFRTGVVSVGRWIRVDVWSPLGVYA